MEEVACPTRAGAYFDKDGDVWILMTNGVWVDSDGNAPVTMSDDDTTLIQAFGPFRAVPEGLKIQHAFRVVNEGQGYVSERDFLYESAKLGADQEGDVIQECLLIKDEWTAHVPG